MIELGRSSRSSTRARTGHQVFCQSQQKKMPCLWHIWTPRDRREPQSGLICWRSYAKHKLADEEDPTAKFWVTKVVEAACAQAAAPRVKRPSTLEILEKILQAANLVLPEFDASLMRAVFSLAFQACTRIGEMVSSNGQPQHAILAQNLVI